MSRIGWITLVIILSALVSFVSFAILPQGGSEDLQSMYDINASRPVYLFFRTSWCTWCKFMDDVTLGNDTIADFLRASFNYIRVDAEQEKALAQRYGIYAYPVNVFTYPNGTEIGRTVGAVRPAEFLDILNQVMAKFQEADVAHDDLGQ